MSKSREEESQHVSVRTKPTWSPEAARQNARTAPKRGPTTQTRTGRDGTYAGSVVPLCPNSRVSVKNLLRASNFRVPNDSRYGIDVHTQEARVTWTSNDRKEQSTGKRRAIAQKAPATPTRSPRTQRRTQRGHAGRGSLCEKEGTAETLHDMLRGTLAQKIGRHRKGGSSGHPRETLQHCVTVLRSTRKATGRRPTSSRTAPSSCKEDGTEEKTCELPDGNITEASQRCVRDR